MTSDKKAEANRRNALRSTGPKTIEGKRIASRNASKLGIFSRELLLEDEDEDELHLFARTMRADLQPGGPMEQMLAEIIISTLWRLGRVLRIESGLFEMYKTYKGATGGAATAFANDASQLDCFGRVARAEAALGRRLYRALQELRTLQGSKCRRNLGNPPIEVQASPVLPE